MFEDFNRLIGIEGTPCGIDGSNQQLTEQRLEEGKVRDFFRKLRFLGRKAPTLDQATSIYRNAYLPSLEKVLRQAGLSTEDISFEAGLTVNFNNQDMDLELKLLNREKGDKKRTDKIAKLFKKRRWVVSETKKDYTVLRRAGRRAELKGSPKEELHNIEKAVLFFV